MKGTDGIYFGEIHSYNDLNLILSKVEIEPAKAKTTYVDIPGGDGSLDLTEVHGKVKYSNRNAKFTFTMHPSGDLSESAWERKKTEVSNEINGKKFEIVSDRDPEYFYSGRCSVDDYLSNKRIRQIVVSAKLNPYKLKRTETVVSVALSETEKEISIMNARKSVIPEIECTEDNCTIVFGDYRITTNAGKHKYLAVKFTHGENILKVSGSGSITFRFREGDL